MKRHVYYTQVTEYEEGWGQRQDGALISFDKEQLGLAIKNVHQLGDYNLYWRCSYKIQIGLIEDETYISNIIDRGSAKLSRLKFKELVETA